MKTVYTLAVPADDVYLHFRTRRETIQMYVVHSDLSVDVSICGNKLLFCSFILCFSFFDAIRLRLNRCTWLLRNIPWFWFCRTKIFQDPQYLLGTVHPFTISNDVVAIQPSRALKFANRWTGGKQLNGWTIFRFPIICPTVTGLAPVSGVFPCVVPGFTGPLPEFLSGLLRDGVRIQHTGQHTVVAVEIKPRREARKLESMYPPMMGCTPKIVQSAID